MFEAQYTEWMGKSTQYVISATECIWQDRENILRTCVLWEQRLVEKLAESFVGLTDDASLRTITKTGAVVVGTHEFQRTRRM